MELTTSDVQVRVCMEDSQGSYHFRCPSCRMSVVKHAEPRIVDLLVASGVELATWTLPAELFEQHDGAPLSHDDLIDFHLLLGQDDERWFTEVVAMVESANL